MPQAMQILSASGMIARTVSTVRRRRPTQPAAPEARPPQERADSVEAVPVTKDERQALAKVWAEVRGRTWSATGGASMQLTEPAQLRTLLLACNIRPTGTDAQYAEDLSRIRSGTLSFDDFISLVEIEKWRRLQVSDADAEAQEAFSAVGGADHQGFVDRYRVGAACCAYGVEPPQSLGDLRSGTGASERAPDMPFGEFVQLLRGDSEMEGPSAAQRAAQLAGPQRSGVAVAEVLAKCEGLGCPPDLVQQIVHETDPQRGGLVPGRHIATLLMRKKRRLDELRARRQGQSFLHRSGTSRKGQINVTMQQQQEEIGASPAAVASSFERHPSTVIAHLLGVCRALRCLEPAAGGSGDGSGEGAGRPQWQAQGVSVQRRLVGIMQRHTQAVRQGQRGLAARKAQMLPRRQWRKTSCRPSLLLRLGLLRKVCRARQKHRKEAATTVVVRDKGPAKEPRRQHTRPRIQTANSMSSPASSPMASPTGSAPTTASPRVPSPARPPLPKNATASFGVFFDSSGQLLATSAELAGLKDSTGIGSSDSSVGASSPAIFQSAALRQVLSAENVRLTAGRNLIAPAGRLAALAPMPPAARKRRPRTATSGVMRTPSTSPRPRPPRRPIGWRIPQHCRACRDEPEVYTPPPRRHIVMEHPVARETRELHRRPNSTQDARIRLGIEEHVPLDLGRRGDVRKVLQGLPQFSVGVTQLALPDAPAPEAYSDGSPPSRRAAQGQHERHMSLLLQGSAPATPTGSVDLGVNSSFRTRRRSAATSRNVRSASVGSIGAGEQARARRQTRSELGGADSAPPAAHSPARTPRLPFVPRPQDRRLDDNNRRIVKYDSDGRARPLYDKKLHAHYFGMVAPPTHAAQAVLRRGRGDEFHGLMEFVQREGPVISSKQDQEREETGEQGEAEAHNAAQAGADAQAPHRQRPTLKVTDLDKYNFQKMFRRIGIGQGGEVDPAEEAKVAARATRDGRPPQRRNEMLGQALSSSAARVSGTHGGVARRVVTPL
eukprot:TRINITY_DN8321_c0_g2_i1.p2 TRINITY_DN8321_c0_g2~~TRINITY_DN8321_c0_g2_i1.p2  ORF type:complete len:1029 (+),score=274.31 TRINITY_DN8321_c0_g2_i1:77-3088(+)